MPRLLRIVLCGLLLAAEAAAAVTLDLPDPLIPGAVMSGTLRIVDPPSDPQSVDLPAVAGLEWRLSRQNSSQTVVNNGTQSTVISVGLVLRAAERGQLALPPVSVRLADGSTIASAARQVRVADGDARLTGDALAEAAFEPASIVPGQPSRLVYRIYLRQNGELGSLGIGPPEGAIALGEHTVENGRTFDAKGRPWSVATITWPFTHATPGTYTVRGQQAWQSEVGDGFFDQRVVRHQLAVPPATLTVEALPAAGRPADFYGLIGPLSARATLDRERVAAGEGAVLSVSVSGRQTDLVKRPALAIAGVQLYPKDESTSAGSRTLRWDVVPAAPGDIAIPALAFPYFDPATRGYRSAETAALTLQVIPGRNRDLGIVGSNVPTAANPGAAQPAAPVLPAPLRGAVPPRPPPWAAPIALGAGIAAGLGLLAARFALARRGGPHRGRALRAAGRDPIALDAALRALEPALGTAAQRAAAAALRSALDRHRYGGEALPDPAAWIAVLEGVA